MGTTEVENFPGFPEGITGPELMDRMKKQADRWGALLFTEDVESIDLDSRPFVIQTPERRVRAHTLIMATGATARKLGIPSESTFWSKGISACAICDGASPLFKQQVVGVVGGGDSACEEAVYLTKYASHVHLFVRGDKLRASMAMRDRTLANKKVTVHFNTTVGDVYGSNVMEGMVLVDTVTNEKRALEAKGLFYGIGHQPNSGLISKWVELDDKGYVKVKHGVSTNIPGVYACGDLQDPEWRQAITAAGSGCQAALSAERYLTEHGLIQERESSEAAAHHVEGEGVATQSGSSSGSATTSSTDEPDSFDINQDKHKGQYALRKLYHSSDRVIAVFYSSPSCGPCRSLKPIFNKVVDEFQGQVHYVEIDIEMDQEIAEAAGVTGTPTIQFFKDKERLLSAQGVKPKSEYRELFNRFVKVKESVAA